MSWHFSRALVEEFSAANSSAGAPSAPSKSMTTHGECSPPDKTTDASNRSQSGTTLEPSTAGLGAELLTWFLGAFRAKTSAPPGGARGSRASEAGSGRSSLVSLARYDPASHSLKTLQTLLFEGSTESLLILPKWGWMHDGECFLLAPLVPHTCDQGCSLWPTPRADGRDNAGGSNARKQAQRRGTYIGRYPNPILIERLMGWPTSWTDLQPLETDKFRKWLHSHGEF